MSGWKRMLVLACLVPAVAACGDDPLGLGDDHEEQQQEQEANRVAFLRLIIASTTIVINQAGTVIGSPVTIGLPGAAVTAIPLDANSHPLTLDSTAFRLDVVTDASGRISFDRTGAFSGQITRHSAGPASLTFALFHIPRAHNDFGPHTVQVTVQ